MEGMDRAQRRRVEVGVPPYGYTAERHAHPNPLKASQGRTKTRLMPDPAAPARGHLPLAHRQEAGRPDDQRERLKPTRPPTRRPREVDGRRSAGDARPTRSTQDTVSSRRTRDERRYHAPADQWLWTPEPVHEPTPPWTPGSRPGDRDRARQQPRLTSPARTRPGVSTPTGAASAAAHCRKRMAANPYPRLCVLPLPARPRQPPPGRRPRPPPHRASPGNRPGRHHRGVLPTPDLHPGPHGTARRPAPRQRRRRRRPPRPTRPPPWPPRSGNSTPSRTPRSAPWKTSRNAARHGHATRARNNESDSPSCTPSAPEDEAKLAARASHQPRAADPAILDEIPYAGDILPALPPDLKARLFAAFDLTIL